MGVLDYFDQNGLEIANEWLNKIRIEYDDFQVSDKEWLLNIHSFLRKETISWHIGAQQKYGNDMNWGTLINEFSSIYFGGLWNIKVVGLLESFSNETYQWDIMLTGLTTYTGLLRNLFLLRKRRFPNLSMALVWQSNPTFIYVLFLLIKHGLMLLWA